MTIDELLAVAGLTANDEIPIWDAEATGEPTKKIKAQNLAASVKTLAGLVGEAELTAMLADKADKDDVDALDEDVDDLKSALNDITGPTKNLLDYTTHTPRRANSYYLNTTDASNTLVFNLTAGKYTLSFGTSDDNGLSGIYVKDANGTITGGVAYNKKVFTFPIAETGYYAIQINLRDNNQEITWGQLEAGESATAYVPYRTAEDLVARGNTTKNAEDIDALDTRLDIAESDIDDLQDDTSLLKIASGAAFAVESVSSSDLIKIKDGADSIPVKKIVASISKSSTSAWIKVTGKNIIGENEATTIVNVNRVWGGETTSDTPNGSLVLPKGYYMLSVSGTNSNTPSSLAVFDSENTRIAIVYNKKILQFYVDEKQAMKVVVGLPNGSSWANNNVQLEFGRAQTDYEAYKGTKYTIVYPSAAGTVSSGTITLNEDGTGTLVSGANSYEIEASDVVRTLKGLNYIWCDVGDMSADYRADAAIYISEKVPVKNSDMKHGWNIFNPETALPWFFTNNTHPTSNPIQVDEDTTYTLSYTATGSDTYGGLLHIETYDDTDTKLSDIAFGYYSGSKVFTTDHGTKYIVLRNAPSSANPTLPTDCAPTNVMLAQAQNSANIYEPYGLHVGVNKLPQMPYAAFIPRENGYIKSVAHRGLSYYFPGNSEEAIIAAAKYGFYAVEIDIQCSSDHVPVLVHEATLNLVTGGALTGTVASHTSEELLADGIEWGTWFDKSMTGVKLCTLDRAIQLCHRLNLHVVLDIKQASIETEFPIIYNILAKYGMTENALWMYGNSGIFSTSLDIKNAGFTAGAALPEGWCASVASQIESAGYTGDYTVFQDWNKATLAEANEVRSYGWNYALYFANTVDAMDTCLDSFGIISEIESDRFTISEAMAMKYGIGWTDVPHHLIR